MNGPMYTYSDVMAVFMATNCPHCSTMAHGWLADLWDAASSQLADTDPFYNWKGYAA